MPFEKEQPELPGVGLGFVLGLDILLPTISVAIPPGGETSKAGKVHAGVALEQLVDACCVVPKK
jgi:hypothetical protein